MIDRLTMIVDELRALQRRVVNLERTEQVVVSSGTWTPVLVGMTTPGTFTYSTQSGVWSRYGSVMYLAGRIAWTAIPTMPTGRIIISNLPDLSYPSGHTAVTIGFSSGISGIVMANILGGAYINLYCNSAFMQPSDLASSGDIIFSATWIA